MYAAPLYSYIKAFPLSEFAAISLTFTFGPNHCFLVFMIVAETTLKFEILSLHRRRFSPSPSSNSRVPGLFRWVKMQYEHWQICAFQEQVFVLLISENNWAEIKIQILFTYSYRCMPSLGRQIKENNNPITSISCKLLRHPPRTTWTKKRPKGTKRTKKEQKEPYGVGNHNLNFEELPSTPHLRVPPTPATHPHPQGYPAPARRPVLASWPSTFVLSFSAIFFTVLLMSRDVLHGAEKTEYPVQDTGSNPRVRHKLPVCTCILTDATCPVWKKLECCKVTTACSGTFASIIYIMHKQCILM